MDDILIYKSSGKEGDSFSVESIEQNFKTQFLFKSASTAVVTTTKSGNFTQTVFPVVGTGEKAILLCNVKGESRRPLAPRTERDIAKLVSGLRGAEFILDAGDIQPAIDESVPVQCGWYTASLEVDDLMDDIVYYDRFRLLELRSDFVKINKLMFDNLQAVQTPHEHIEKVLSLVLIAFLGMSRAESVSWQVCRKYCNEELRRALLAFDPSMLVYSESLLHVEKELLLLPRSELIKCNIQPIVVLLHDWLAVCCSIAKAAELLRHELEQPEHADNDAKAVKEIKESETLDSKQIVDPTSQDDATTEPSSEKSLDESGADAVDTSKDVETVNTNGEKAQEIEATEVDEASAEISRDETGADVSKDIEALDSDGGKGKENVDAIADEAAVDEPVSKASVPKIDSSNNSSATNNDSDNEAIADASEASAHDPNNSVVESITDSKSEKDDAPEQPVAATQE